MFGNKKLDRIDELNNRANMELGKIEELIQVFSDAKDAAEDLKSDAQAEIDKLTSIVNKSNRVKKFAENMINAGNKK